MIVRRRRDDDWDGFRVAYDSVAAEGRWIAGELPTDWEARRDGWFARNRSDRSLQLVVEDDGRIVGFLGIDIEDHGRAELGMALVDGYRGRGLGSALLTEAIDWARAAGAHKVYLERWTHNDGAGRLYERHGFVVEGILRRHWRRDDGSLWDSVAMGLVLDEESPGHPDFSSASGADLHR